MVKYDWVTDFMKAIQRDYLFYDKTTNEFRSISFYDEKERTAEGEVRHYREVCFAKRPDVVQPINDEYVYYQFVDAEEKLRELSKNCYDSINFIILGFRHSENDWSTAISIEKSLLVNRLGWGIFMRKNLLEPLSTEEGNE